MEGGCNGRLRAFNDVLAQPHDLIIITSCILKKVPIVYSVDKLVVASFKWCGAVDFAKFPDEEALEDTITNCAVSDRQVSMAPKSRARFIS